MKLDAQDIEQIAVRVAALLREQAPSASDREPRFVDAATVARLLGVERDWVYEHAAKLGAVRLGGPRGRLRFDRLGLGDRLAEMGSVSVPRGVELAMAKRRPRGAARPPAQTPGELVPMPDTNRSTAARRPVV